MNSAIHGAKTSSPIPRQGLQKRGALLVITNESWFPWDCICNKSFHLANTLTHHTSISIELIVSFISSWLAIFDYTYHCDSYLDRWLKRCSQFAYCLASFTAWFFANMLYNILCWVLMKVLMMIPHFNVGGKAGRPQFTTAPAETQSSEVDTTVWSNAEIYSC